ncbi:MAG: M20/M25/M40 family metallo-hydrolase [Proteobacteria bacterium]|nr:M20/M25/M40 family metallo-hydrolase [Pseudomonadota bacterium]
MDNERLINTFCDFVKIPSETPNDREFILYMGKLLKKEGAEIVNDTFGNLLARFEAKNSNSKEPVLFCCHADTVKPGVGIQPVIENGVIKSKGDTILGADDKAGIAEIVEMLRSAKKHPPIEFLIARCEETGPSGAENLEHGFLKSKKGYVIDMDAPGEIIIGGPTYFVLHVKYKGRSAHAGVCPEKGISAIQAAAVAVSRLKLGRIDEGSTTNVGTIKGGQNMNSIPADLEIFAECRSLNDKKARQIADEMTKIFEQAGKEFGAQVSVQRTTTLEAYEIPKDSKVVQLAVKAMEKNNIKPDVKSIAGGTDATHLNHYGIQTAVLGVGARLVHSTEEYAIIDEMVATTKIITSIVEDLA